MVGYTSVPDGYDICIVQQCMDCEGTGWRKPGFSAHNQGRIGYPDKMYGTGAVPPPVQCTGCVQGFRFGALDISAVLPYLLQHLQENARLRQAFLDIVVAASQGRMLGTEPSR
jgi:hypothetical protein